MESQPSSQSGTAAVTGPPAASRRNPDRRRLAGNLLTTGFFALFVAGLCWLAIAHESRFNELMWEDSWGEWASCLAFALCGMVGLIGLGIGWFRQGAVPEREQRFATLCTLGGLAVFGLLAAAEEISWGQRILGFMPPEIFQTHNFQQEFNFHNILQHVISPRVIFALICFGYGLALPAIECWRSRLGGLAGTWTAAVAPAGILAPWFGLAGVIYWVQPVWMSLEAAELLLGLLLLADVTRKVGRLSHPLTIHLLSHPLLANGILVLPLLGGAISNPLIEHFVFGVDEQRVATARRDLKAIAWDLQNGGAVNPNLAGRNILYDSRIFNALNNRWLYFSQTGRFRSRTFPPGSETDLRQTYFLDPWNNAYWIRMQGNQPVFLYSFGPNRRLDTILSDQEGVPGPAQVKGDDIGFWFEIDPEMQSP